MNTRDNIAFLTLEATRLQSELARVTAERDRAKAAWHDAEGRLHHEVAHNQTLEAENARLRGELEAAQVNADKFLWLEKRYCGADFSYGDRKRFVILFSWPASAPISSNLSTSIESAQLAELFDGKVRIDGEKA